MADGWLELLLIFGALTAFWAALFYGLALTERSWAGHAPPSSKAHENNRYWSARNLIGIIHAVVISALTVPALFLLADDPDEVRFAYSPRLAWCEMPPEFFDEGFEGEALLCQGVAFAGLAFTAFTTADVVISVVHGLATPDYVAHHIAFITAGLIIRSNCMLPYNAAILLSMEISTPFLNYMLFYRNRGESFEGIVQATGAAFVILFIIFRLGINTFGAVLLLWKRKSAMPDYVPEWQVWFLLVAVCAGAAVQFFWFPAIARTFGRGLVRLCCEEDDSDASTRENTDQEDDEKSSRPEFSEEERRLVKLKANA